MINDQLLFNLPRLGRVVCKGLYDIKFKNCTSDMPERKRVHRVLFVISIMS